MAYHATQSGWGARVEYPLEPTQYGRQVHVKPGEPTGMVFCPARLASIATMRCGEYQERHGCGFGCASAARPAEIAATRAALRLDPDEEEERPAPGRRGVYPACVECGGRKISPHGRMCAPCGRRRAAETKAAIVERESAYKKTDLCIDCKRTQVFNRRHGRCLRCYNRWYKTENRL